MGEGFATVDLILITGKLWVNLDRKESFQPIWVDKAGPFFYEKIVKFS